MREVKKGETVVILDGKPPVRTYLGGMWEPQHPLHHLYSKTRQLEAKRPVAIAEAPASSSVVRPVDDPLSGRAGPVQQVEKPKPRTTPQEVPTPPAGPLPQSRAREVSDPRTFEGYIRQLASLLPVFQRYYHKKTTTGIRFVLPEGFPPPETAWVREGWIEVRGKNELSINVTSKGLEALDKGFVVALVRWCRVREWARNHRQDGARVVEMSQEEAETVLREYAKHFPSEEGKVRVEVALERMEGGHAG